MRKEGMSEEVSYNDLILLTILIMNNISKIKVHLRTQ